MKSENNSNKAIEETSEYIDNAKDKMKEALKSSSKEVAKKYAYMEECMLDYVKENPWKSLGVSLLSGIVIATILRK